MITLKNIRRLLFVIVIVSIIPWILISSQNDDHVVVVDDGYYHQLLPIHHNNNNNNNSSSNISNSITTTPGLIHKKSSIDTGSSLYQQTFKKIKSVQQRQIRKWGCRRNETPFMFIHLGKSGGGSIRARLAASSQNYTRSAKDWSNPTFDNHYYELPNDRKAYFCNSRFKNHRLPNTTKFQKTYEGNMACYAKTPIGMALGCPETTILGDEPPRCKGCDDLSSAEECNIVYTSHNVLGNELHYLPPKYLTNWWMDLFHSSNNYSNKLSEQILNGFIRLQESNKATKWCPQYNLSRSKVIRVDHTNSKYTNCSKILSPMMDTLFDKYWKEQQQQPEERQRRQSSAVYKTTYMINYAPIYSSLPIHRTTVLREPFSWLLSKFFWHRRDFQKGSIRSKAKCDDINIAIFDDTNNYDDGKNGNGIIDGGWATEYCIEYILYFCGDDCVNRYDYLLFEINNNNNNNNRDNHEKATMFLKQIELQAATNLRQSISVVGLLNESDSYLDMINKRISYIDTTRNKHVFGGRHGPSKAELRKERIRCMETFNNNLTFQNLMRQKSLCIQSLERLYEIGVAVNRFQQQELKECV